MVSMLRRAAPVLLALGAPLTGWCGALADQAAAAILPGRPAAHEVEAVRGVYAQEALRWSLNGRLTPQGSRLLEALRSSATLGLAPEDYGTPTLTTYERPLLTGSGTDAQWRDFDVRLSRAAARLLIHLHYGRIDPTAAGFELPARAADLDVPSTVAALATTTDLDAVLRSVEPQFYHYTLLKAALAKYRALAAGPVLTRLPPPGRKALHPGDEYAGAPQLQALLLALGDLSAGPPASRPVPTRLDPYLVGGLKVYQQRHGLPADGALGARTFAELTTPMTARVRQIELTLERWRWLPKLEAPPIIVNIPQFQLFAFRSTADRLVDIDQMAVIVGKSFPRTRTPVFVGTLKYVIFHPYWDIPRGITTREMLPALRAHPDYLQRNHMEFVRGEHPIADQAPTAANLAELASGRLRMRQRPGDDNALGPIKFVLPNVHDVYLHGTPAHHLFAEARRAFSHGCIRVADPVALAEYALRNNADPWDAQRIAAAVQQPQTLRVALAKPIKVMILYATALATEAGPVDFFDDVYGNDRRLAALLWPPTST
jgi:L,D-transpeptidase YcbB